MNTSVYQPTKTRQATRIGVAAAFEGLVVPAKAMVAVAVIAGAFAMGRLVPIAAAGEASSAQGALAQIPSATAGATTATKSASTAAPKSALDRSARTRVGKASFYAKRFGGRKMADGTPMLLQGNNAASKTLPLGTTALVTNLKTGRAAVVTIRDRGPYVKDRIVDLSPSTAQKIGLEPKEGITKVEVAPITVPQADGTMKLGTLTAQMQAPAPASGDWHD